jgi:hypothetical protein
VASKRKEKMKALTAAANPAPGVVWELFGGRTMELLGFLVTERGNPQRPIAGATLGTFGPSRDAETESVRKACRAIAAKPDSAGDYGDVHDLRQCCRPDSPRQIDRDFFGLLMSPEGLGWEKGNIVFWPFCRFAVGRMLGFHVTEHSGFVAAQEEDTHEA